MQHFPAAGEIVIFDRSWYNRAGVEYVMGFCTKEQHAAFSKLSRDGEYIVEGGIQLIKIWLEVSDKEQKRRFEARIGDPLAPMEAQPDGPALAQQMVRVFARARHDAQGHRHEAAPWYILRRTTRNAPGSIASRTSSA
jgi:polyphosphate kinase 2 (PPK2 family)